MTSPKYASLFGCGGLLGLIRKRGFPRELPDVMDGDMAAAGWQLQPLVRLEETIDGIADDKAEFQP